MKSDRITRSLEQLREVAKTELPFWTDLLGLTDVEYQNVRRGVQPISVVSLVNLAQYLGISLDSLSQGEIDLQAIAAKFAGDDRYVPERYTTCTFSKRWGSLNLLNYAESFFGWELKHRAIRRLQLPETFFSDPNQPVNVHLISDLCEFMHKTGWQDEQFFLVGAHSLVTYLDSPIGKWLSKKRGPAELFQALTEEVLPQHIENNFSYRLASLDSVSCVIEIFQDKNIADGLGIHALGNSQFCSTRAGLSASIPGYLGLPFANVMETKCVHRGDAFCRHEVDFEFSAFQFRRRKR
jgi:hypothetical protein